MMKYAIGAAFGMALSASMTAAGHTTRWPTASNFVAETPSLCHTETLGDLGVRVARLEKMALQPDGLEGLNARRAIALDVSQRSVLSCSRGSR